MLRLWSVVMALGILFTVAALSLGQIGCGSSKKVAQADNETEDAADEDTGTEVAAPSLNLLRVDTSCSAVTTSGSLTGVACLSGSPFFGVFEGGTLKLTDPYLQRITHQVDQQVLSSLALQLEE